MHPTRLKRLRQTLVKKNLDGLVVSQKENVYYLTGTHIIHPNKREAYLFITQENAFLYHSIFLTPPKSPDITFIPMDSPDALKQSLLTVFENRSDYTVGIESQDLTVYELGRFRAILSKSNFKHTTNLMTTHRLHKDKSEIENMRRAGKIAAQTMEWAIHLLSQKRGDSLTEKALAQKIEQKMKTLGADDIAFPVITAFDKNSALPHHIPNSTKLNGESVVLLDLGCKYQGYCSDMTRTIKLGKVSQEFHKVERTIHQAYKAALTTLKNANTTTDDVDLAARNVITKAGYGRHFIHSTGHGLGLEIHEPPSLYHTNHTPLPKKSTFTIEPGIYLKGQFGYRYENTLYFESHKKHTSLTDH